jgi:hypothetical protein
VSRFRGKWRRATKNDTDAAAEAGKPAPLIVPRCHINPRTGSFIHGRPHSCAPQARSSFKPRKQRKEYRKRQRRQSRTRTGGS